MAGPYGDPQGYSAAIMQHQKQQQLLQAAAQREAAEASRQRAWQQEYEHRMGEGFAGPATPPPDMIPVGEPGQYHTSQSPEARKWQPLASGAAEPSWSPIEEIATAGIGGAVARGLRGAARRMVGRGARPTPQPRTAPHTEVTPLDRRLSSVGTEAQPAPQSFQLMPHDEWVQQLRETNRRAIEQHRRGAPESAFESAPSTPTARRRRTEVEFQGFGEAAQPMPRPAPGTRVKSTGPGVRKLTDAEKELMRENAERYRREAGRRGAAESSEKVVPSAAKDPISRYKKIHHVIDLTKEGRKALGLSKKDRFSEEEVISILDDHQIPWDAGDYGQIGIKAGSPEHGYKTLKNPTVQQMMDWLGY